MELYRLNKNLEFYINKSYFDETYICVNLDEDTEENLFKHIHKEVNFIEDNFETYEVRKVEEGTKEKEYIITIFLYKED